MSRKYLGLDIQNSALAAVLIESGLKGNWIRAHSYIPYPEGKDEIQGLEAALEALVSQVDIAGCSCIASFPSEHVFFRNMSVPFKQASKIRQVLPFELEPTMPMPIATGTRLVWSEPSERRWAVRCSTARAISVAAVTARTAWSECGMGAPK